MNKTIIDIEVTHRKVLSEFVTTVMINEGLDRTSDFPVFQLIGPAKYPNTYTTKVADDISLTRQAMKPVNKRAYDDYKDILNKVNPVGLEVPRVDTKPDEEIDKSYKELQTVILDKFNEASSINENGEGWVRFINTLATPMDRAANYIVPKFNNVYDQFRTSKLSKVSKADVLRAIDTLSNYDKYMEAIETNVESAISDYKSKLCTLKTNNDTLNENLESLSEALYIIESDYITAQSCLAREKALNESLINSYKILSALSMYNPRQIKETSVNAGFISETIADTVKEIIENADSRMHIKHVPRKEVKTGCNIDKFTSDLEDDNDKFLNEYKDRALKSNSIGLSMSKWYTPIPIDSMIDEATNLTKNVFSEDNLRDKDIKYITKLESSIRNVRNALLGESYDINSITSMAARRIMELSPWIDSSKNDWYYTTENHHIITKNDIRNSVDILEGFRSDIYSIYDNITSIAEYSGTELPKEGDANLSEKAKLIRNIEHYRDDIILSLESHRIDAKVKQLKLAHSGARTVLLKAARVFNEDTFVKEHEHFKVFSEKCDKLLVDSMNK